MVADKLADDKSAQDRAVAVIPLVLLALGQHCPPLDSPLRSSFRREKVHLVDDDAKVVLSLSSALDDGVRDSTVVPSAAEAAAAVPRLEESKVCT